VQPLVQGAIDLARVVPIEALERLEFAEHRHARTRSEVARLALAPLELDEALGHRHGAEALMRCVLEKVSERLEREAEAELLQPAQHVIVWHRSPRGRAE
jgi:hypothetical protein